MIEKFRNRSIGDYIKLGAGALAFLLGIIWLIIYFAVLKSKPISFTDLNLQEIILLVVGGLLEALSFFFDFGFDIVGPIVIACGVAAHLYMACFPWADILTGVAFFVNDAAEVAIVSGFYTTFLVIDAIVLIASLVAAFIGGDKKKTA